MSLDKDGGGIDRFEFVIGMLIRLEVVATEDVDTFLAHFSMLDESGDGTISKEELQRYAALQTAKAERVGIVQHQLLQETAKRSQPSVSRSYSRRSISERQCDAHVRRSHDSHISGVESRALEGPGCGTISPQYDVPWFASESV
mmetsp:Transcript_12837/g.30587  ORF Transcript_12837/g.30587 Transcript_12837/m.30587 type:complete len:144 (+) Transcript_12837:101-532(+)